MRCLGWWFAFSSMVIAGCSGGGMELDGGATNDVAVDDDAATGEHGDAGTVASDTGLDATVDANDDAFVPIDAFVPSDSGLHEECNRLDDDLDGRVDEDSCRACRNCPPCTTTERDGNVLLYCTVSLPGLDLVQAWMGTCEQLGPGYRLLDLDSDGEAIWAEQQVGTRSSLVGVRGWGTPPGIHDASGTLRSESSLRLDPEAARLPDDRCFVQTSAGLRQTLCANAMRYTTIFCEGAILGSAAELCQPSAETCDATDEDCDGKVDEGVCAENCLTTRFVDHVYRACDIDESWADSRDRCHDMGGELTMIDSDEEGISFAEAAWTFYRGWFWVGLENRVTDGGVVPTWVDDRVLGSPDAPWVNWFGDMERTNPDWVGTIHVASRGLLFEARTAWHKPAMCEWPVAVGP